MISRNFSLLSLVAIYTPQAPQYRPQGAIKSLFFSSSSVHPSIESTPYGFYGYFREEIIFLFLFPDADQIFVDVDYRCAIEHRADLTEKLHKERGRAMRSQRPFIRILFIHKEFPRFFLRAMKSINKSVFFCLHFGA